MQAKIATYVTHGKKFLTCVTQISKSSGSLLNSAKLLITEISGAAATLVGIAAVVGWQYALIIGGVAVIFAIERQPSSASKSSATKADMLKSALTKAKAAGTLTVTVDDILKVL